MLIGNLLKYQDLLLLRAGKTSFILLNIVLAWVLRHLIGCTPIRIKIPASNYPYNGFFVIS